MMVTDFETPGKRTPDGYRENEFNYHCKLFLIEELKRHNMVIIDCSPGRVDNSLVDRANRANNSRANLFVSIHYNANTGQWGSWGGIETFHFPGSTNGRRFATFVQNQLVRITGLRDRGVKEARFTVLTRSSMPAILAECGFMDNREKAALMRLDSHRKNCAIAIMRGICQYFGISYIPEQTNTRKNYRTILQEVSKWSKTWIEFVDKHHATNLNLKGLVEVLYYTRPKSNVKGYENILKDVSNWSNVWITFVNRHHSSSLNVRGIIEVLYETVPK